MKYFFQLLTLLSCFNVYCQTTFEKVDIKVDPLPQVANFNIIGYMYGESFFRDIDNDGDKDFIVTGTRYAKEDSSAPFVIVIYENKGEFIFAQKQRIELDSSYLDKNFYVGKLSTKINPLVQDLDGDGNIELAVHNRIFKLKGGVYQLSETKLPTFTEYLSTYWMDFDNDKDIDLIRIYGQEYWLIKNNGKNEFIDSTLLPFKYLGGRREVIFHDIDNDGDVDVFANSTDKEILIYLNDGKGNLAANENSKIIWKDLTRYKFLDTDGDNKLELIAYKYFDHHSKMKEFRIFKISEDYKLTQHTYFTMEAANSGEYRFMDLNNDDKLDLYFQWKEFRRNNKNRITSMYESRAYINYGAGNFREDIKHPFTKYYMDKESLPHFIDIDNDGDEDFLSNPYSYRIAINDGKNNFSKSYTNISHHQKLIHNIDLNDDGLPELIFRNGTNWNNTSIVLCTNLGNGKLDFIPQYLDSTIISGKIYAVNLNKDKLIDFIHIKQYRTKCYVNQGGGNFKEIESNIYDQNEEENLLQYDFDNDGDIDLLFHNIYSGTNGNLSLYLNDGNGRFIKDPNNPINKLKLTQTQIASRDYNNDGFKDILIKGYLPSRKNSLGYRDDMLLFFENDKKGNFFLNNDTPWKECNIKSAYMFDHAVTQIYLSVGEKQKKVYFEQNDEGYIEKVKELTIYKKAGTLYNNNNIFDKEESGFKKNTKWWVQENKKLGYKTNKLDISHLFKNKYNYMLYSFDLDNDKDLDLIGIESEFGLENSDIVTTKIIVLRNTNNEFTKEVLYSKKMVAGYYQNYNNNFQNQNHDFNNDGFIDFYYISHTDEGNFFIENKGNEGLKISKLPVSIKHLTNVEDMNSNGKLDIIGSNDKQQYFIFITN